MEHLGGGGVRNHSPYQKYTKLLGLPDREPVETFLEGTCEAFSGKVTSGRTTAALNANLTPGYYCSHD